MWKGNENVVIQSLRETLSFVKDPRDNRGKKHNLVDVLILIVVGYLVGKNDYTNMEHFFKLHKKELFKYMKLKNGIPSHDTMSRIVRKVESDELVFAIGDWFSMMIEVKGKHLVFDGKGIRGATERCKGKQTPYILNVLEAGSKMVLMQLKVGEKTNEITAISDVLDWITIKGATITIDAIGTQRCIMKKIIEKGGNFVLPAKENQKELYENIRTFMNDEINTYELNRYSDYCLEKYEEIEEMKKHGRKEKRTYYSVQTNDCIVNEDYKMIKTVGMVIRETTIEVQDDEGQVIKEEKRNQKVAYVSNKNLSVREMANYIRNHWEIESMHYILDNSFKEDRSTQRKENSKENSSLLRKVAYNALTLYKQNDPDHSYEYFMDEMASELSRAFNYVLNPIEFSR